MLVDYLDWRWLFALPVVLVVIAFLMTLRNVPNSQESADHGFDFGGALISIAAIIGLIYFLHEGPTHGWATPATIAGLIVGIVASVAFVAWELRHPAPLLDIRLFRQRGLTSGSVALLTWFGVQAGVFIVLYPFFQAVLGWSGLRATLGLMPMAILMMGFSGVAPHVAKRFGARATLASGVFMGGLGLTLIASIVSVSGGYLSVLPGMVVMGIGMGLSMAPATEAITTALPNKKQGVASALNDVTREFGTALGVALLGAVFSAGYSAAVLPKLAGLPEGIAGPAARGIATALDLAGKNTAHAEALRMAAKTAFVEGWQQAMWSGVVVMGLLFIFVVFRGTEANFNTKEAQNDA